jgi:hypothetical protein
MCVVTSNARYLACEHFFLQGCVDGRPDLVCACVLLLVFRETRQAREGQAHVIWVHRGEPEAGASNSSAVGIKQVEEGH